MDLGIGTEIPYGQRLEEKPGRFEIKPQASVADGRSTRIPYVGPIKVAFGKRFCYVGALVLGDEVLLGVVPMEDMDLVVDPARRKLTVDPASPNLPHARVK